MDVKEQTRKAYELFTKGDMETFFNEMIDLANSIKSNFDMGLFDENLNKVDAQTLEYLREEVSQTDMGYGTWRRNKQVKSRTWTS